MPKSGRSGGTPSSQERRRSGRHQTGRSSERLKKKGQREFSLPDKAEILASLVTEGTPAKSLRDLRPRKLVNNFVKERNRYNNPDGIDLFDDDPLSNFVADDNEVEEDQRREKKKKRSRKQRENSSSEWENSDEAEYSEGSAFSESDDVLDDDVPSEENIDSEDEDGEPAVDVVSDKEDDGSSSTDAASISSTEEFLQKRKKKSLKKIEQKVTSSTWWRTNKGSASKSARKRRTRRRTGGGEEESDDSDEEPSRLAKNKKRRSSGSDDDDDDERPSCSRRHKRKRKESEKKRRPKAGRAPVIDDEDDTDDETETATPSDPPAPADERQGEGEHSNDKTSEKSGGENESGESSTEDEDNNPTSSYENNGDSPIVARGKRRKSKQPTVESSDETETELPKSSSPRKDASGSSLDKDNSSSDAVHPAHSAKRRIVIEDEDDDSSNIEGNDVMDVDESTDNVKDDCESLNASKEIDLSVVEMTEQTESRIQSDTQDAGSSRKEGQDESEQGQIEHASDKPEDTEEVSVPVSDGTDKEVERSAQKLPENEDGSNKENEASKEVAERDSEKDQDVSEKQVGSAKAVSLESILDEGTEESADPTSDTNEATIGSVSSDATGGVSKDAADDKKDETAQKDEDGYASDDSLVEIPVPPKTPPPEITLSSDEDEQAPVTTTNTDTTSTTSNTATGGFHFGQGQGTHPSLGNPSMSSQFQQNSSGMSSIAEALSRSSASINSNPFGRVLGSGSSGFGMQRTALNNPHQQQVGSGPRMPGPAVSSNQMQKISNQGATGALNNIIRQSSIFSRSNQSNMPNQQQPAQNPQWRGSWNAQVQSGVNQRQQMAANASGYQSQVFSQTQNGQRVMPGGVSGQQNIPNPNSQMQVSSSQFSGNTNRPVLQNTNSGTQQYQQQSRTQYLSHHSWGRTPNTIGQSRQQLWGRTPNTMHVGAQSANQNSQTSRFASQVTQMRGNTQRLQQSSGRLEILSVSSIKPANQQSNTIRNMPQVSRGSVQPSTFGNQPMQSNRPAEQRTNFSGNPFSSHGHANYNQQSYATSNNNQFPQSNYQTGSSGFGESVGFRTSTGNVHQPGFPNRQISPQGGNLARYPGPGSNGMVSQQTAHFTHNSNANAARLKSIRDRVQQLNQQRQQLRQQRQQLHHHQHQQQWIQQCSITNSSNQLPQQLPNSISSSASAASSQPLRPCSFQSGSMPSGSGQVQPGNNMQQQQQLHQQQPIVTRSFATNLSPNASNVPQFGGVSSTQPQFGNMNSVQQPHFGNVNNVQSVPGVQSGSHNPAVSLPASVNRALANADQQVSRSTSSAGNFVQEAYQHLHSSRKHCEKSCNNIRENITAMRKIQDEMKSMVDRNSSSTSSKSTNELTVLSQTIISEVSTVRVEQPSSDNMLPDIDSLQPNGLDLDAVGGNMLTDINDAVLASISDAEQDTTDQGCDFGATDIILGDDPLVTPEEGELLISPHAVATGNPAAVLSSDECSIISQNHDSADSDKQPKRTPVVMLRDILSQVKSVNFGEASQGQSLSRTRSHSPLDICPGKKFCV